jgi:hypothetical protein
MCPSPIASGDRSIATKKPKIRYSLETFSSSHWPMAFALALAHPSVLLLVVQELVTESTVGISFLILASPVISTSTAAHVQQSSTFQSISTLRISARDVSNEMTLQAGVL